jgi:hypothetical protein
LWNIAVQQKRILIDRKIVDNLTEIWRRRRVRPAKLILAIIGPVAFQLHTISQFPESTIVVVITAAIANTRETITEMNHLHLPWNWPDHQFFRRLSLC